MYYIDHSHYKLSNDQRARNCYISECHYRVGSSVVILWEYQKPHFRDINGSSTIYVLIPNGFLDGLSDGLKSCPH